MFGAESLAQLENCPVADEVSGSIFWLTQNALLGGEEDLNDIVTAILKIQAAWS
jgi:hypothetical protein